VALFVAPVEWRPETVVLLPVAIASGTVIFGALWVATTSIVFWTIDGQETANAFTYGGRTAAQYPLDIVGGALRRLVTFVVPLAFVGYLPAARMLGKDRAVGLPSAAAWAAPAVAFVSAIAALGVWGIAIRHYRSTGS
jgi:ABC-2 type transport system permease protein